MAELSEHEMMRRSLWMETFTTILEAQQLDRPDVPPSTILLSAVSADEALKAYDKRFKEASVTFD